MREGYKKTEVGVIPEDWEVKSTGELFSFSGGMSISRQQLCEDGVNYLHYGDIHKRKESILDLDKDKEWMPKLNQEFDLIKDDVKLNTGDVVFADASEDYEGIGKSIVVLNKNNDEVVSGLHTIVAKGSNEVLDTQYKRYCFSTENVRKQFRKLATGTSVYGISRENIKKIKILVPPLKEQEKIAEILSTVDSQIDDTEKLIEKSKELKKGLMQKLLTKGIGHSEFKKTEVGEIPASWEVKKLGEISNLITKGTTPSTYGFNFEEKGINFIKVENLLDNGSIDIKNIPKISKECHEKLKRSQIEENDILFSIAGSIGKTYIVNENLLPCNTNQALAIIRIIEDEYDKVFLRNYLNSYNVKKYIKRISTIGAQPNMSLEQLGNLKIILPPLIEQKKIANILSSIDREIEEYEDEKRKLEELKKGLMQQLLTGKIKVTI